MLTCRGTAHKAPGGCAVVLNPMISWGDIVQNKSEARRAGVVGGRGAARAR